MRQLTYIIDKNQSEVNQALVLLIIEAEIKGFTMIPTSSQQPLNREALIRLSSEKEKQVIEFLMKEEERFLKNKGKPFSAQSTLFNQIRIGYPQSIQALKLIAGTGKLYFGTQQLVPDFFDQVSFSFHLQQNNHNATLVTGKLKTRNEEFDIQQCDFLCQGAPHWFIKGMSLKLISTDISWKYLKKAANPTPWLLTAQEQQDFLNDFEEIENGTPPQIIFDQKTKESLHKAPDLVPILVLKDRSGAFAELKIFYGEGAEIAFHDPAPTIHSFKRNAAVEQHLEKDLLETDFIKKIVGQTHYYCPLDKVAKSLTFLLEVGWKIVDCQGNQVVQQSDLQLAMSSEGDNILIKGKVKYESFEADVSAVIGAFNRRDRFVSLSPGKVGLLPDKWNQPVMDTLINDGEIVQGAMRIKKNRLSSLSEIWNSKTIAFDNSIKPLKERFQHFTGIQNTLPGESFKGQLRPYQQDGLNWLSFLYDFGFHGLLADDMGLGKTVQVLAFLSQIPLTAPSLIILPTSLLFNWRAEIEKFLKHSPVYLHHGLQRSKDLSFLKNQQLILTSYTTLRQDFPLLSQISYQCVILDEAQVIKNAQTQIAQAVCSLQSHFRLSITGTPIENHLLELWSHFHFLMPDLLGSEESFNADAQASSLDHRYLERIKKKVLPFLLRRTKEQVAKDLPERIDQVVLIEMPPEQRKIYEDFLSGVKGNLLKKVTEDGLSKHRMEVLEAILRLRQICCHPLLVSSMISEDSITASAKMDTLLQDIATGIEEGKKMLIYSQFTSMLQLLSKAFRERNWAFSYLDGSTKDREKVVQEFQEKPSIPLFLISLKAGGVGLNLTAADYVLIYDPWWNEAVENQAISRAHRIGRKETVIAKRYINVESIEEKMMKLKSSKRAIVDGLLDGDGLPQLSEDDFLFLLS